MPKLTVAYRDLEKAPN